MEERSHQENQAREPYLPRPVQSYLNYFHQRMPQYLGKKMVSLLLNLEARNYTSSIPPTVTTILGTPFRCKNHRITAKWLFRCKFSHQGIETLRIRNWADTLALNSENMSACMQHSTQEITSALNHINLSTVKSVASRKLKGTQQLY